MYHERIHLALNCETLGMNVPMTEVAKRLKETDHVVQVLVKDPPTFGYTPSFMLPDILMPRRAYPVHNMGEGW